MSDDACQPAKLPHVKPAGQITDAQASVASEMFIGTRGRLRTYAFELAAGCGYPLLALAFFLNPHTASIHSIIAQRVYPFDYLWNVGYMLGALGLLFGVFKPALRVRAAGLIVLGTALTMQSFAAAVTRPDLRELFNALFAVACLTRAYMIVVLFVRLQHAAQTVDQANIDA